MLEILLILIVLAADQLSKYLTVRYLSPVGTSYPLWEGVFHLTYTQNRGAAWGLMQGRRTLFIIVTVAVCIVLIVFLLKFRKGMHWISRIALALILSGAAGNLIDRVFLSYVRDMFDFCLIHFPVFNIADSALTIGSILLAADVLFLKEQSLLAFLDKPRGEKAADGEAAEKKDCAQEAHANEETEGTHAGNT